MSAPGVRLIQTIPYRGNTHETGNLYHFVGSAPSDDSGWDDLVDDLAAIVGPGLSAANVIVRAYCYTDTDNDSVYTSDLVARSATVTGSNSPGSSATREPGDVAAWIRWKTARVNSKGKPIYLRKYYHCVYGQELPAQVDALDSTFSANMASMGNSLRGSSGSWPGLGGPDGVEPALCSVSPFLTTRTLLRRGKRP